MLPSPQPSSSPRWTSSGLASDRRGRSLRRRGRNGAVRGSPVTASLRKPPPQPRSRRGAAAPAPGTRRNDRRPSPPQQSFGAGVIHTSGWIGGIILLLSIYFVMVVVRMFLDLKAEEAATQLDLQACDNLLKSKDLVGLYKLVKQDPHRSSGQSWPKGRTELRVRPRGLREAVDRARRRQDAVELEKRISMLAVLGLLGAP